MNILFTEKELQVIELIEPSMTAEEVCNKVLRDWFNNNAERMYNTVKTKEEKMDEIISVHSAKAQPLDKAVVK